MTRSTSHESVTVEKIRETQAARNYCVITVLRGGAGYILNESLARPAGLRLTRDALKDVIVQLADADGPPLTNARVHERTGLDRVEALRLLDELVSKGLLERVGTRRGTRYLRR